MPNIAEGALFAGRYRVRARLGDGGMGAVYLAVDELLGEELALKVAGGHNVDDAHVLEAQRREVALARRVTHPHVARVYDLGVDDGLLYITMERVPGTSLRTRLHGGPLPVDDVVAIGHQIASALAAAHDAGVVHLDLKPDNVVVVDGAAPRAVLLDFGVSRALGERASGEGTLDYMAPEQLGDEALGGAADVYALGLLLSELLTGHLVFTGTTPTARALARLTHKPPRLGPPVPTVLATLVDACLARAAGDRPSARTLERELARSVTSTGAAVASAPAARGTNVVDLAALAGDLGLRFAKARADLAVVGSESAASDVIDEVLAAAPNLDVAIAAHALALVRLWNVGSLDPDVADRAVVAVSAGVARAPHLADSHVADALIAEGSGDIAYAVRALRRALARDPLHPWAHEILGRIELEAGVGGEQRVRMAHALDPLHVTGLIALARDRSFSGRDGDADALIDLVQAARPDTRELLVLRWRLALYRNDKALARAVLAVMPTDHRPVTEAFRALVNHILGTTSLEAAVAAANALLSLPTSPMRHAFFHQILADVLAATDPVSALGHVVSASGLPLADLRWLDASPLLAPLREHPAFRIARATVLHRLSEAFGALSSSAPTSTTSDDAPTERVSLSALPTARLRP